MAELEMSIPIGIIPLGTGNVRFKIILYFSYRFLNMYRTWHVLWDGDQDTTENHL